jgi:hypothetical protein
LGVGERRRAALAAAHCLVEGLIALLRLQHLAQVLFLVADFVVGFLQL